MCACSPHNVIIMPCLTVGTAGRPDMNRAMDGDVVAVELLPEAQVWVWLESGCWVLCTALEPDL